MAMHFIPFLLLFVLVLEPFPTLAGSRRTLQAESLAPSTNWAVAPGSSASPGSQGNSPTPAPTPMPTPTPTPTPVPTPKLPPSSGGGSGGGGGGVGPPRDDGDGSSKGLSGGQKAGIILGVLAAAGLIGFATIVFMKRQSNIRRARFGLLARRSQL